MSRPAKLPGAVEAECGKTAFRPSAVSLAYITRPGESPRWMAQTIGIEALVSLSLAAGEAHITLSLTPLRQSEFC
jgi:hypothetical protein